MLASDGSCGQLDGLDMIESEKIPVDSFSTLCVAACSEDDTCVCQEFGKYCHERYYRVLFHCMYTIPYKNYV